MGDVKLEPGVSGASGSVVEAGKANAASSASPQGDESEDERKKRESEQAVSSDASSASAISKSSSSSGDQFVRNNALVYAHILRHLIGEPLDLVLGESNGGDGVGAWKILLDRYERKPVASRGHVYESLMHIRLEANENVTNYVA